MNNVKKFKDDLRALCKKHKIKLKLIHTPTIDYVENKKIQVSGYFDSGTNTLAVATDKDKKEWLEILIHESCHLDQYLEGADSWEKQDICNVDVNAILDLWMGKHVEMEPKQLKAIMEKIIDCERDCDIRSVKKIKEYGLDNIIDLKRYVQKANAYHLSYDAVKQLRKWNKPLHAAYQIETVLLMFPTVMCTGYTLTKSQFQTMKKYCY
jgi:hypothetical protein